MQQTAGPLLAGRFGRHAGFQQIAIGRSPVRSVRMVQAGRSDVLNAMVAEEESRRAGPGEWAGKLGGEVCGLSAAGGVPAVPPAGG